jgi:hypothetical protein
MNRTLFVTFRIQDFAFITNRFGTQNEDPIIVVIAAIFFGFDQGITVCIIHFTIFDKAQLLTLIIENYVFLTDVSELGAPVIRYLAFSIDMNKALLCLATWLSQEFLCCQQHSSQEYYAENDVLFHFSFCLCLVYGIGLHHISVPNP